MKNKIRLYVCGPMRGIENYNFPAFDAATLQLRVAGYIVASPADMDRACGFNFEILKNMSENEMAKYSKEVFPRDIAMICANDGIAFLPGSFNSKGATAEMACAKAVGIKCQSVEYWLALGISKRSRRV